MAFDYAYLSRKDEDEEEDAATVSEDQNPLLVMRDGKNRGLFPYIVQAKGVDHAEDPVAAGLEEEIAKLPFPRHAPRG